MKLSDEHVKRIDALIEDHMVGWPADTICSDFGIKSTLDLSRFFTVLRQIGIPVPKGRRGMVSSAERAEFLLWRTQQRASQVAAE